MINDLKVVAVRRDSEGNLSDFKLSDGREVSKNQCADLIETGELRNMIVQKGRSGATVIRAQRNTLQENLSELPTF